MLKIDFINVGYGDSILLRESNSHGQSLCILVDTGELSEEHYLESSTRIKTIDFLRKEKVNKIDILVVTHLHKDHVGGLLNIVREIPIGELWVNYKLDDRFVGEDIKPLDTSHEGVNNLIEAINCYNKSISVLAKKGTPIKEINMPFNLEFSTSFKVDVLCANYKDYERQRQIIDSLYIIEDHEKNVFNLKELDSFINNTSIVLKINYNNRIVLLGADVNISFWDNIKVPRCDILKLPHHGHKDAIDRQLALQMNPEYVVICVSNTRKDDCPSREPVKALYECANPPHILCTDDLRIPPFFEGSKGGSITFEIDKTVKICST